ncbi:MAG TPA: wax ester/triacylglycerol synthase domain-containing protein [Acidimicrobiia bacterium]|nr:wax ester/triacylglycerol synthase domain-containing protein [Acidimicrobiia bacterium]
MRMSDTEAIMWAVEKDPALRSDFCNLTILDRRPSDERMRATMERALAAIPRLRQRVIGAPLRLVPPEFADDPNLDVESHVRVVGVPPPGDERAFFDLCGSLSEQSLDRARPLWEFTIIDGMAGGRAALLQKVHHAITDGVGGLRLSLAMVDFERDPEPVEAPDDHVPSGAVRHDTPLDVTRQAIADAATRRIGAVRSVIGTAGHAVTHPLELPSKAGEAARFVGSLQRQSFVSDPARSDVLTDRSLRRRFEVHALVLSELHAAARSLGGSINDAFVTGLASALGRYHQRFGSDVEELRVAMPVSTRQRGDRETTNAFAPVRLLVPIQPAHDVVALFKEMHDRLEAAKGESAVTAAAGLAGLVSGLPTSLLVALTRSQTRTIDFAASNLRGSPVPLYLAGARILANYPFGPRTGSPLNVTMLSYCDELHLGCNIDPAAVVDPEAFLIDLRDAYAELIRYA